MSRFQKIFLASALVVVGFGVAKFLGQPVLPKQVFSSRNSLPAVPVVVQTAPANTSAPQTAGRVRLLPDSAMTHAGAPAATPEAAVPQPPRLGSTLAPVLATNENVEPRAFDLAPIASAPIGDSDVPRARLRNEAPRPVGVDPRSPAAIRRVPSETSEVTDPYKVSGASVAPPAWSAPPLFNTGYSVATPSPPITVSASYAAPATAVTANQVAPPPWPIPEETAESRTHVVVDGDSLERLASRYLSDSQRGREIYELNREVLSAPDLLPIGAELKIPERVASTNWDRRSFQPNSATATQNRNVGREKIAPVFPASAPQTIIPRAQLAPPVMVQ